MSILLKPNVQVKQPAFGERIKIKEVSKDTPIAARTVTSVGTSFTTEGSSGGASSSGSIVSPLIKLIAVFSPALAAWVAGNMSSAGTTTSMGATTTANKSATNVVKVVVEKDSPLDPS
ncbi:MAG: hypothetical protein AB1782_01035 [Cyanobacteriota bacterium]